MSEGNSHEAPKPFPGLIKRYFIYSRAPFFSASVIPVLLGAALAYRLESVFRPVHFIITLVGLMAAHAGVNLANDFYDFRSGVDALNRYRSTFSGGTPFLVEGADLPKRYFMYTVFSFALAAACGISLIWLVDRGIGPVFWLMLAGFIGGFFYSAPPFRFSHRGIGEIFILLCFGPLPILGAYYVQTGSLAWLPVWASVPAALLITNVIWINEFPDAESDERSGKKTLVVRLGKARSRYIYHAMMLITYAAIILLSLNERIGPWFLAGLVSIPIAIRPVYILHRQYQDSGKLVPAMAGTVATQLVTGVALTLALVFG